MQQDSPENYRFEQQGRRPVVIVGALMGLAMAGLGIHYGAPWYFTGIAVLSSLMAMMILVQNSRSGMRLEDGTLTVFKDQWRQDFDVSQIQRVRVTQWTDGQPSIWIERVDSAPYRLPGYCFGSATQLTAAFRARGIDVV